MGKELEKVITDRVTPKLNEAMQKFLGITIKEIDTDISDKLSKSPFLEFDINTKLKFREAKENFKRAYVERLVQLHLGNITQVADISGVDRRSIHRLIKELGIDIKKHRTLMLRRDYIKQEAVQGIIESTLDMYKEIINPEKLNEMYRHVPGLSKEIISELPDSPLTLKEAENEFERRYLKKVLKENGDSVTKTAKKIGIRYETLHRKIKALGID